MSFGLFGKMTAVEGKRDELAAILLDAAEALRPMNECKQYVVSISEEDPDSIYISEIWENEEAHQASLSNDEVRQLIMKGRPMIADMKRLNTLTVLGGKGLQ